MNMSQSSFSMGVFPIVLRKKRSSIRSEEINLKEGRSRSSFPNLEESREVSVWVWLAIKSRESLGEDFDFTLLCQRSKG